MNSEPQQPRSRSGKFPRRKAYNRGGGQNGYYKEEYGEVYRNHVHSQSEHEQPGSARSGVRDGPFQPVHQQDTQSDALVVPPLQEGNPTLEDHQAELVRVNESIATLQVRKDWIEARIREEDKLTLLETQLGEERHQIEVLGLQIRGLNEKLQSQDAEKEGLLEQLARLQEEMNHLNQTYLYVEQAKQEREEEVQRLAAQQQELAAKLAEEQGERAQEAAEYQQQAQLAQEELAKQQELMAQMEEAWHAKEEDLLKAITEWQAVVRTREAQVNGLQHSLHHLDYHYRKLHHEHQKLEAELEQARKAPGQQQQAPRWHAPQQDARIPHPGHSLFANGDSSVLPNGIPNGIPNGLHQGSLADGNPASSGTQTPKPAMANGPMNGGGEQQPGAGMPVILNGPAFPPGYPPGSHSRGDVAGSRMLGEQELVDLVLGIMPIGEDNATQLSAKLWHALESRLHPFSWEQHYRPQYGTLMQFLEARPELFYRSNDGTFYRPQMPPSATASAVPGVTPAMRTGGQRGVSPSDPLLPPPDAHASTAPVARPPGLPLPLAPMEPGREQGGGLQGQQHIAGPPPGWPLSAQGESLQLVVTPLAPPPASRKPKPAAEQPKPAAEARANGMIGAAAGARSAVEGGSAESAGRGGANGGPAPEANGRGGQGSRSGGPPREAKPEDASSQPAAAAAVGNGHGVAEFGADSSNIVVVAQGPRGRKGPKADGGAPRADGDDGRQENQPKAEGGAGSGASHRGGRKNRKQKPEAKQGAAQQQQQQQQ